MDTKKLIESVLGHKLEDFIIEDELLKYSYITMPAMYEHSSEMCIYKFANMVKKWARTKDRRIEIQTHLLHTLVNAKVLGMNNDFVIAHMNLEETEPEAVIKAGIFINNNCE